MIEKIILFYFNSNKYFSRVLQLITKLLNIKDPNIKIMDVINRGTH